MRDTVFGYDYVDGKMVINETEADLLRFIAAKNAGETPTPPEDMVARILKHHKDEISLCQAQELAQEEQYIDMYYRTLCREKYVRTYGHEPPSNDHIIGKMHSTPSSVAGEPIIDKDLFDAAQPKIKAQKK